MVNQEGKVYANMMFHEDEAHGHWAGHSDAMTLYFKKIDDSSAQENLAKLIVQHAKGYFYHSEAFLKVPIAVRKLHWKGAANQGEYANDKFLNILIAKNLEILKVLEKHRKWLENHGIC